MFKYPTKRKQREIGRNKQKISHKVTDLSANMSLIIFNKNASDQSTEFSKPIKT